MQNINRLKMADITSSPSTKFLLTGMKICFIFLFLGDVLPAYSRQHIPLIPEYGETGFLHLNNNVFTSGDILRYTAYLTNNSGFAPSHPSTVYYFDLVSPQNEIIIHWRANADQGISTGNLYLPDSLQTGIYVMRFYTQLMLNQDIGLIPREPIVIVNIKDENPAALTLPFDLDYVLTASDSPKGPSVVKPEVVAQNPVQGDSLTFSIEIPESLESATLSISVERSSFPKREFFITDTIQNYKPADSEIEAPTEVTSLVESPNSKCPRCIKEEGFYILSGRVCNPQSTLPYDNQVVFISYSDRIALLKYTITDDNGNFCFPLDKSFDNRNLVLQLDGLNETEMVKWEITPKELPVPPGISSIKPISHHYTEQLEEIRKLSLVSRIFSPYSRIVMADDDNTTGRNFFSTPSYTIFPAEYEHLETFSEIARNLLVRVRFRKSGNEFRVGIADGDNQRVNYDKILFLLNGHPFHNLEFISRLSSADIRSIDVVYSPFMFGDLKYNGLVSIHTANGIVLNAEVFASPVYVVNNLVLIEQYIASERSNTALQGISPSVLWIPSATINKGEIMKITTPVLHLKGDYVFRVAGFSDNGEPIQQKIMFSVKDALYR
jgi:hypothetical protein